MNHKRFAAVAIAGAVAVGAAQAPAVHAQEPAPVAALSSAYEEWLDQFVMALFVPIALSSIGLSFILPDEYVCTGLFPRIKSSQHDSC